MDTCGVATGAGCIHPSALVARGACIGRFDWHVTGSDTIGHHTSLRRSLGVGRAPVCVRRVNHRCVTVNHRRRVRTVYHRCVDHADCDF
eukprot:4144978-Prymnesium_polylepis.1